MMLKLTCLVVLWLAQIPDLSSGWTSSHNHKTKLEMESVYDKITEDMLSLLETAHSRPHSRKKRELDPKISLTDDTGVYYLKTVIPVSKLCSPSIYSAFVDVENQTYAICISMVTADHPATIYVGLYKEHSWTPFSWWYAGNPKTASAFHFKNNLFILIADSDKADGTDLVKINLFSKEMVVDHTVSSKYAAHLTVWKMKVDGTYHMTIANTVATNSEEFKSDVFVYKWMGTYFDKYSEFRAYDVKDIEAFHIHGAAYLAVANYRKSNRDYRVDSEILKYNLDKHGWVSVQKIQTNGAMDWEFFSLGQDYGTEFFLAVTNHGTNEFSNSNSMIYKFVKDKFVPFQCLPTTGATSVSTLTTESMFLLAVANDDSVHLYQYDGWRFVISRIQYTQRAMSFGVVHLTFHGITGDSGKTFILSVSNPRYYNDLSIFEIGFEHRNDLQTWYDASTDWCLKTLQNVESSSLKPTLESLNGFILVDQSSVTIDGNLTFDQGFTAQTIKTPMMTEIVTQQVYDSNLLHKLEKLHKRLQFVETKLHEFSNVLGNALKKEGNQSVSGILEFQDVVFDCQTKACHFDRINTIFLNEEKINNWNEQLVFIDSNLFINGTLYADEIQASNIHVLGYIDGVKSDTLVTKSGVHTITGRKVFTGFIQAKNIEVSGLVDGVRISPTDVLLTTGHQKVTGQLTFDEIDTEWLEINHLTNGINLSDFYRDMVLTDQSYTITGKKIFQDIAVADLTLEPGSTINGIDLVDLWTHTFWKDGNQDITAQVEFTSVTMAKNLNAPAGINGIEIPGPHVVDIHRPADVIETHIFLNLTKISQLKVLESINGLTVNPDSNQLDIMLKSTEQTITGKKTFHTIHLEADSFVGGTVDGVDLSELKATALRRDASAASNRTWIFNNLVIKGPLFVGGSVSGVDINDIYNRALLLNDTDLPRMEFRDTVHVEELESYDINGINVSQDLVLANEEQDIRGKKVFRDIVLEENSIVLGMVNNINMSFFNETLLKIGNQTLQSKVFTKNVKINRLTVTGAVNGIPFTEFVTLNEPQVIHGPRILNNVEFADIETEHLDVSGRVNGIDLEEMMKNTMTYNDVQVVTGSKTVNGTIFVPEGKNLQIDDINGININELWEDAVFVDINQTITGKKIFSDSVAIDNLAFTDTIDGIPARNITENWMLRDAPQVVKGNVYFLEGFTAADLNVGLINDIDLKKLNDTIVKVNENAVVEGPVIFQNLVISKGDIRLTGKVQGIDLSEEAVPKSDHVTVTGLKTFVQDLVIEGDLTVEGLVDGISVADVCKNTLLVNKEQNFTQLVIQGNVTLSGGGTVDGKVGGVNLTELQELAILKSDADIKITGNKEFQNLTLDGPVTLKGKFGGVDLEWLSRSYMSLSRDQDISARMEFEQLSFNGTLTTKNFNTEDGKINEINIIDLDERILKKKGNQVVSAIYHFDEVIFNKDVHVTGKVNGLYVQSDLMRKNGPNYIQSRKIFQKPVVVLGDLFMDANKQIQGVDVSDWYDKAVLKDGGRYVIDGHKTFLELETGDIKVEGLLDGMKISDDNLLMAYGNQVVTGQKRILGNVEIKGALTVQGLINGTNINYLANNTVRGDLNNTITGLKSFKKPLTVNYLQAPTVAGVNIMELRKKIYTQTNFTQLRLRLEEIGTVVSNMQIAFENQAIVFQYYELFQEFALPSAYSWHYIKEIGNEELLLLSENSSSKVSSCSSIRIFIFNNYLKEFVPHPQELIASYAVSVKSLSIWNSTFLFVANQNANPLCSETRGYENATGDIYVWTDHEFTLFQTLELNAATDMVVFKDENMACFVYLEIQDVRVFCASSKFEKFSLRQTLPTKGGRKASIIQSQGKTILAIASEEVLTPRLKLMESQTSVDIYVWNHEAMFSEPVQVLLSIYAQSIQLMSYSKYSNEIFLVVAEGSIPKIRNEPKISIYRYEDSKFPFQKYQEIKEYGDIEWITLETGELIFFILNSRKGEVKLFQYKGASGFVHVDSIISIGSISVHPFVRKDAEDKINHYLALAGPRAIMAQPTQGLDYAKILKSKVKGRILQHY